MPEAGLLHIVVCAEYDALPGVGHACGHNIIAAAAVGAGAALAAVADDVGLSVTVLGTPAEEGGGGKILMLERGAFDGAHAAMMIHPWPEDRLVPTCLAVDHIEVSYTGRSAHASAAPYRGINAGDALTIAQVAIGLLRQHLNPGNQVHGIVTKGGDAPNVVPAHTEGNFMLRALTLEDLRSAAANRTVLRSRRHRDRVGTGDPRPFPRLLPHGHGLGADKRFPAERRDSRSPLSSGGRGCSPTDVLD